MRDGVFLKLRPRVFATLYVVECLCQESISEVQVLTFVFIGILLDSIVALVFDFEILLVFLIQPLDHVFGYPFAVVQVILLGTRWEFLVVYLGNLIYLLIEPLDELVFVNLDVVILLIVLRCDVEIVHPISHNSVEVSNVPRFVAQVEIE